MTGHSINLTEAYLYMWNLCLDVWRWTDSINITLGPITFTLFELFISLIALFIIWEMLFIKLLWQ